LFQKIGVDEPRDGLGFEAWFFPVFWLKGLWFLEYFSVGLEVLKNHNVFFFDLV
jgi:hypothetical protein